MSKYGSEYIFYATYIKVKNGYKLEAFSKVFKTLAELKSFYTKSSAYKVKFIKGY